MALWIIVIVARLPANDSKCSDLPVISEAAQQKVLSGALLLVILVLIAVVRGVSKISELLQGNHIM